MHTLILWFVLQFGVSFGISEIIDIAYRMEIKLQVIILGFILQVGWTALIYASQNGHSIVVEKLLSAGAKPDHQDKVSNLITRVGSHPRQ